MYVIFELFKTNIMYINNNEYEEKTNYYSNYFNVGNYSKH